MPLQMTSLAQACEEIRRYLSVALQTRGQPSRVLIGKLTDADPGSSSDPDRVNLLFYRIEPDGSAMGAAQPTDPWLVRLHLLVTPFSSDEDPSVGQNDLRMLGEVAAIFHERPILDLIDVQGEAVRLNVVPETLSTETLNQLWSVQGEVGFRPSIGYDVSLVPVVSNGQRAEAPLVGDAIVVATPFSGIPRPPGTGLLRADLELLGFDQPSFLSIASDDPSLAGMVLPVRVTSPDVTEVDYVWELLSPETRWRRVAPAFGGGVPGGPFPVPEGDQPPAGDAHQIPLPAGAGLPPGAYQLVLRPLPAGASLNDPALHGRPIVISVYEDTP